MSHLEDLISALVDGELSGTELDRANAHLAACARCQAEVARLRDLKRELRDFGAVTPPERLTQRLLAMGGPNVSADSGDLRRLSREPDSRERRRRPRAMTRGRAVPRSAPSTGRPGTKVSPRRRHSHRRHSRGRRMLWSAMSLVVVGIGAAAFSMGGSPAPNGRQITPQQLEVFDIQHAITAGEVPFADPSKSAAEATKP